MEVIQGKVLLIIAWVFALVSGHIVSVVFSVVASCLAGIYWLIKIRKELKQKDDVGKV